MAIPTVWFYPEVMQRLRAYCQFAEGEISGLGAVHVDRGDLVVSEVMLFKQVSSGSETELDEQTLADWDLELRRNGGDPSLYRLWWHKHPIESWSGTDSNNIDHMNNGEWLLSVVKTPTKFLARLDLYHPFRVTMDNLVVREISSLSTEDEAAIKAEIAAKVTRKTFQQATNGYQNVGYQGGNGKWAYDRGHVYVSDGKGGWTRQDEDKSDNKKKGIIDIGTNSQREPSTGGDAEKDNRDEYFRQLADQDWEDAYNWNDRDPGDHRIRERLYKGWD